MDSAKKRPALTQALLEKLIYNVHCGALAMESLVNWYKLTGQIICLHLQNIDTGLERFENMTIDEAQDMFRGQDFT
jgi:hypothetical protein